MLKNCHNYTLVIQHFSFGPPLGNYEKKVVYLIGKAEILIDYTIWAPVEQALLIKPTVTRAKHFDGECITN